MDQAKQMYNIGLLRYIGEDKSYIETAIHCWQAEIVAKKRNLFRPCQGLAAMNLLLDTMPCLIKWTTTLTDSTCDTCGSRAT
jgi:hypothetical protein